MLIYSNKTSLQNYHSTLRKLVVSNTTKKFVTMTKRKKNVIQKTFLLVSTIFSIEPPTFHSD